MQRTPTDKRIFTMKIANYRNCNQSCCFVVLMSGSWLKRNGDQYLTECRVNDSGTILVGHSYSLPLILLIWLQHTPSLSSALPLSYPSLSHFSLYDTSKWSCRDVSPHPRLIGAQRSNQGRTNRTVLVISCDQCSLGSWEMRAHFCHYAWACIVTWADPWLDVSGETEIGTAKNTDVVWGRWSLLLSKTHRKNVNISHACDAIHRERQWKDCWREGS